LVVRRVVKSLISSFLLKGCNGASIPPLHETWIEERDVDSRTGSTGLPRQDSERKYTEKPFAEHRDYIQIRDGLILHTKHTQSYLP